MGIRERRTRGGRLEAKGRGTRCVVAEHTSVEWRFAINARRSFDAGPLRKVRRTKRPVLARKCRTANKFGASVQRSASTMSPRGVPRRDDNPKITACFAGEPPPPPPPLPPPPPPPPLPPPRALILRPEKTRAIVNYFA